MKHHLHRRGAGLLIGLLALLLAGCGLFKPTSPEVGNSGTALLVSYADPETCLSYMALGIENKDNVGLTAYTGALAAMARLLAVRPDQVTPVPSTSAGLFQVAFGLIGAGGNVVVPTHEFPANLYPWLRAAEAGGPEVRLLDCPDGTRTT